MSTLYRPIPIKAENNKAITIATGFSKFLLGIFFLLILFSCQGEKSSSNEATSEKIKTLSQSETQPKKNKKVVLFFGDSLTVGFGLDEDQSFPSLIEDMIDSLSLNYTVVNAGLSGETTSGGLKRIDWVMRQPVDIFFLALGANDMLRGLPLEETKKNLSQIIKIVQAKNPQVKIALCEMVAAPNMGADYVKSFNRIFKELASEYKLTLVPFFLDGVAGQPSLLLKDGKHPNAEGQAVVAKNIWKTLGDML